MATFDDLLALPADVHAEILDGEIVEKANPTFEHGDAQLALGSLLRTRFHRGSGGPRPSGWWIVTECDVELEPHEVVRPDLVEWRRESVPERPHGRPIRIRPGWICEVLSVSNASSDLVARFRLFQRHGVPHHWIVDPERELLTVYRWTQAGYLVAAQAGRADVMRAKPFEEFELRMDVLFGGEGE